jgi:hypothetical protein
VIDRLVYIVLIAGVATLLLLEAERRKVADEDSAFGPIALFGAVSMYGIATGLIVGPVLVALAIYLIDLFKGAA